jgi:hypothetical protein
MTLFSGITAIVPYPVPDEDEIMSSRFDKRLEEAGLLDHSKEPNTSLGSTEDMVNVEDPGYALLTIQSSGPAIPKRRDRKHLDNVSIMDDDGGYASPADALKSNPRIFNLQKNPTPSPPTSPMVTEQTQSRSPSAGRASPYESVNDIRRMREKQIKERGGDEKRDHPGEVPNTSPTGMETADSDQGGYSRPFDALNKFRMGSDANPSRKPVQQVQPLPWLRTSSNSKTGGKEASARALHHVVSPTSSKGSLDGVGDMPPRSASTSLLSSNKVSIMLPAGNGGKRSLVDPPSPVGSKHDNQTLVDTGSGSKVNRYILQVENKEPQLSRGETGRTRSIDSALYTPAKVTKLRNGRDRVTLISGKSSGPIEPKTEQ